MINFYVYHFFGIIIHVYHLERDISKISSSLSGKRLLYIFSNYIFKFELVINFFLKFLFENQKLFLKLFLKILYFLSFYLYIY